jgi:hypothetical protein
VPLYKTVIADNPTFGIAHWGLGRSYWAEHKYLRAVQEFEIDAQLRGDKGDAELAAAMDAGFRNALQHVAEQSDRSGFQLAVARCHDYRG